MKTVRLVIDNPHPLRSPMVVTLTGSPAKIVEKCSSVLREFAARLGMSPLALSYRVAGVTA